MNEALYVRDLFVKMATKCKVDEIYMGITPDNNLWLFIYVTVLGHSPLSCPVAWRQSSSPIGLGYRRYASTHLLNALQMAALRAAI